MEDLESIISTESLESRTHRQELIRRWDQKALNNARVVLIGSGPLCHYVAAALTGLQVGTKNTDQGKLILIDYTRLDEGIENEFLYLGDPQGRGEPKVYCLSKTLSKMNNEMRVEGIPAIFVGGLVKNPSVVVDLTNDPESKSRSFRYSVKNRVPYISASTDANKGTLISHNPKRRNNPIEEQFMHHDLSGKTQGAVPSGFIGGLVVDEIRRAIFRLNETEDMLNSNVDYNIFSNERFVLTTDGNQICTSAYKYKKVAVIGAGALGNFVGINLALMGVENVTFIDYDIISGSNLNRQPCFTFYRCIRRKKVEVIADVLKMINPNTTFNGIDAKIVEAESKLTDEDRAKGVKPFDINQLSQFDLIISCPDNPEARLALNRYVSNMLILNNRVIPLVDGATDNIKGSVAVYIPGNNACIDSQIGYSHVPKDSRLNGVNQEVSSTSCSAPSHMASVVYTNLITGSFMCGEVSLLMLGGKVLPIRSPMYYNGISLGRVALDQSEFKRCQFCK